MWTNPPSSALGTTHYWVAPLGLLLFDPQRGCVLIYAPRGRLTKKRTQGRSWRMGLRKPVPKVYPRQRYPLKVHSWQGYGLKEVRKAAGCISQGKDLATRERQGYGFNPAELSVKSQRRRPPAVPTLPPPPALEGAPDSVGGLSDGSRTRFG